MLVFESFSCDTRDVLVITSDILKINHKRK